MYLHVYIERASRRHGQNYALVVDKDEAWIEEHVARPRRRNDDVFIDGQTIPWSDIAKIRISQTEAPTEELMPAFVAKRNQSGFGLALMPDTYYVAEEGKDVTDSFISGPPGQEIGSRGAAAVTTNRKAVMVIYGQDLEANTAMFEWLRSLGLQPREWAQLVAATGIASPFVGDVVERAFADVQAVVALFTPDEHVLLRPELGASGWRLQARPNVQIEAGMAFSKHPDRTIIAVLRDVDIPSDLSGRNYVLIDNTPERFQDLKSRLETAGCELDASGTDWLRPGRFPDRSHLSKAPS